ncbi:MAG: phosphoadenylyl-sulfate reductase [Solirubrobacteraceae bacterium]
MRGLNGTQGLVEELDAALAEAGARYGDQLVMLVSFQKEESVLVEAAARVAPQTRFVTIDTGVLFGETLATWREYEERYGIDIAVEDARGDWSAENCCSDAKVAALERALDGAEAWVTGIRREQSPTRANAQAVEHDDTRGITKYNPLALWAEEDLWAVINAKELPYNELHDQGYDSIGCVPCTAPGKGRAGRWVGTDKLECGIHVTTVRPAAA